MKEGLFLTPSEPRGDYLAWRSARRPPLRGPKSRFALFVVTQTKEDPEHTDRGWQRAPVFGE